MTTYPFDVRMSALVIAGLLATILFLSSLALPVYFALATPCLAIMLFASIHEVKARRLLAKQGDGGVFGLLSVRTSIATIFIALVVTEMVVRSVWAGRA